MKTMTPFQRAISFVLPHENAYARGHWGDDSFVVTENVSGDAGGLTKWGIDAAGNPGVDIAALTKADAIFIYHQKYWLAHNLDALPEKLAICAFDVWVNGGHATRWLQHAYNIAPSRGMLEGRPGLWLKEDGDLGPLTIRALTEADEDEIATIFLDQRDERFRALAERPSQAKFLAGWLARDRDLRKFLSDIPSKPTTTP